MPILDAPSRRLPAIAMRCLDTADGLVVRPFEPELPLTLALVFSRLRPLPQIVLRLIATLRDSIDDMQIRLKDLDLPGEAIR